MVLSLRVEPDFGWKSGLGQTRPDTIKGKKHEIFQENLSGLFLI